MEQKSSKDRLREITDSIEQGIKDLFESEKYKQYLRTMSRFHRYSVNNTLLIAVQRPDATRVAGYNKWRDQFGRHVRKGEKGIQIIEGVIKTYFENGGEHIQINVVDDETLKKAQQKPEDYRGLMVRVAGYMAYFTELDKAAQDTIIYRTAHLK